MTPLELQLVEFFRLNEPQVVLASYSSNHTATLQFLDCDDYRIGTLVCEVVFLLCITTQVLEYGRVSICRKGGLPEGFAWLEHLFTSEDLLIVMYPLEEEDDDDDEQPLLPAIGGRAVAYIVCKSAHYEKETNPGR